MFDRLFRRGPQLTPPALDTDYALDDYDLRTARDRVAAGDWTAARDVVAAARDDWELRGRRISVLSDFPSGQDGWLHTWLNAAPDDPTATAILAAMLATRAAEARGSASAANTSDEQFHAFAVLSQHAAEASARARTLADPRDPTPYAELLGTMFAGSRSDRADMDAVFRAGATRDPFNFDLHLTYVSLLCEKWFGSHEEMFAIARTVAAGAPPGSSVAMLPHFAHFEFAMREFSWDRRDEKALAECGRYFGRPDIQRELDAGVAKWRALGEPPRPGRRITLRHYQALGYVLGGRREEAKAVFDELGPHLGPASSVWAYFWGDESSGLLNSWRWANGSR